MNALKSINDTIIRNISDYFDSLPKYTFYLYGSHSKITWVLLNECKAHNIKEASDVMKSIDYGFMNEFVTKEYKGKSFRRT